MPTLAEPPEMAITRQARHSSRNCCNTSSPSISGMKMSSTTRSGNCPANRFMA